MSRKAKQSDPRQTDVKQTDEQSVNKDSRRRGRGPRRESRPTHNDFGWLSHYTDLLKVASRLPLARFAGRSFDLTRVLTKPTESSYTFEEGDKVTVPGIFTIATQLTMGTLTDVQSPGNLAVRNAWADLRSKVSGTIPVGVNELFVYYAAAGQFISYIGWCDRLLAFVRKYSALNRYLPEALFAANGVDYSDFKNKIAEFAIKVAYWKEAFNRAIFLPKNDYLKNAYYLFSQVYTDADGAEQAQLYMFVPFNFGIYDATFSDEGAGIDYDTIYPANQASEQASGLTTSALMTNGDEMLEAMINDQAIMDTSGLLRRTYGDSESNYYTMDSLIDFDRIQSPIYDPEILLQIHNLRCTGSSQVVSMQAAIGTPGTVEHYVENMSYTRLDTTDVIDANVPVEFIDPIVTDPKEEVIVMATRLKPTFRYEASGQTEVNEYVDTHDIALPIYCCTWYLNAVSHEAEHAKWSNHRAYSALTIGLCAATQFDWAPVAVARTIATSDFHLFGDVYNMQAIDLEALSNIHMAKLLSLFKIG